MKIFAMMSLTLTSIGVLVAFTPIQCPSSESPLCKRQPSSATYIFATTTATERAVPMTGITTNTTNLHYQTRSRHNDKQAIMILTWSPVMITTITIRGNVPLHNLLKKLRQY